MFSLEGKRGGIYPWGGTIEALHPGLTYRPRNISLDMGGPSPCSPSGA